jgi:hypothetical protein
MKMDKKKLAAISAAVFTYMKTAEEAAATAVPKGQAVVDAPVSASLGHPVSLPGNIWGISGRQAHMQANSMMQLRMFK